LRPGTRRAGAISTYQFRCPDIDALLRNDRLASIELISSTPEAAKDQIRSAIARSAPVIKKLGLKGD
jgi:hypothetical protein